MRKSGFLVRRAIKQSIDVSDKKQEGAAVRYGRVEVFATTLHEKEVE